MPNVRLVSRKEFGLYYISTGGIDVYGEMETSRKLWIWNGDVRSTRGCFLRARNGRCNITPSGVDASVDRQTNPVNYWYEMMIKIPMTNDCH